MANVRGQIDDDFAIRLLVDGVNTAESRNADGTGSGYLSTVISIPLHLTTGQQVWVAPNGVEAMYGSNGSGTHMFSWFAAYLIGAD